MYGRRLTAHGGGMRATPILLLTLLGCDPKPERAKLEDVPAAPATKPTPAPKPKPVPPKPAPPMVEPPPPAPPSFEADWKEAVKIIGEMKANEPARTEAVMKLFTASELREAKYYMKVADARPDAVNPQVIAALVRLGMTEHLHAVGAVAACEQPEFIRTAKELWHPGMTPADLAVMAAEWCMIDSFTRSRMIRDVADRKDVKRMQPEVRDAILRLGGREWLTRY